MYSHRILPNSVDVPASFKVGASAPSIDALSRTLTINSQDRTPLFAYDCKSATVSAWTAEVGDNLTIQGTGAAPTFTQYDPWGRTTAWCAGGKRYETSATPTSWEIGTKDAVIELIIDIGAAPASSYVIASHRTGVGYSPGWILYVDSANRLMWQPVSSVNGAYVSVLSAALSQGINHAMLFVDRSGSAAWYVNGVESGAAIGMTTVTDITATIQGAIFYNYLVPTNIGPLGVSWFACWAQTSWLDTHLQGTLAADRFHQLAGTKAGVGGVKVPTTATRAYDAYLDIYVDSTTRKLVRVGSEWIRYCSRKDSAGTAIGGILPCPASENELLYSEDFSNAAWAKTRSTVSSNVAGVLAPDGKALADGIVGSNAENTHFVGQDLGHDTGVQIFSVWIKLAAKTWAYIDIPHVSNCNAYYNLNTSVLGTVGAGATAGIEAWGNGWSRCWIKYTATAANHSHNIYPADGDGDNSYTGDAATVDLYVWGAMHEDAVDFPSSYIYTAAAAATRLKDQLVYDLTGSVNAASPVVVKTSVLLPNVDNTLTRYIYSLSDGGAADQEIAAYEQATGDYLVTLVDEGANQATQTGTTDLCNGVVHKILHQCVTNDVRTYYDGVEQAARDTSATITTEIDKLYFGEDVAAANQFGGLISRLEIFKKKVK